MTDLQKTLSTGSKDTVDQSDGGFTMRVESLSTLPNLTEKPSQDEMAMLNKEIPSLTKEISSTSRHTNSRFYDNFEELEVIGKGASGEVVKVR